MKVLVTFPTGRTIAGILVTREGEISWHIKQEGKKSAYLIETVEKVEYHEWLGARITVADGEGRE